MSKSPEDVRLEAEYLRQTRGGERWPVSKRRQRSSDEEDDLEYSGGSKVVCYYEYRDATGRAVMRKVRWEPKFFTLEHRSGGEWVSGKGDGPVILYRLPELLKARRNEP